MAAKEFSFDVVSRVDRQEVKNAVLQAQKEMQNRYDMKGTKADIEFEKEEITIVGDDEFRVNQVKDILFSKLIKRGIDARQIEYGKMEPAGGMTMRQKVNFKVGIPQEEAKKLTKQIRDKGLKVNAQISGDELRVAGKDKDDLQKAITFLKSLELPFPIDFVNYR